METSRSVPGICLTDDIICWYKPFTHMTPENDNNEKGGYLRFDDDDDDYDDDDDKMGYKETFI